MKKTGIRRCMKALAAAVLLTIAGAFSAQAGSADKTPVPVSLHLDVNSRQTAVSDCRQSPGKSRAFLHL